MISTETAAYLMRIHVENTTDIGGKRRESIFWPVVGIVLALAAIGLALN